MTMTSASVNTAVATPIPMAIDATMTAVASGLRSKVRWPNRTSWPEDAIQRPIGAIEIIEPREIGCPKQGTIRAQRTRPEVVDRQRVCGTGNDAQCSGVGRNRPGSDTAGRHPDATPAGTTQRGPMDDDRLALEAEFIREVLRIVGPGADPDDYVVAPN